MSLNLINPYLNTFDTYDVMSVNMKPTPETQAWLRQKIHEQRILDLIDTEILSIHTGLPLLATPSSINSKMALFDTLIPVDIVGTININEVQSILPLRAVDDNSNFGKFIESISPVFEVSKVPHSQPKVIEFYYLIEKDLQRDFFDLLHLIISSSKGNIYISELDPDNLEIPTRTTIKKLIKIVIEDESSTSFDKTTKIADIIKSELYDQFSVLPIIEYIPMDQLHLSCKMEISKYALGGSDVIYKMINLLEVILLNRQLYQQMISSIIQGLNNFIFIMAENHGDIIAEITEQLKNSHSSFSLLIENGNLVIKSNSSLSKVIPRDQTRLDILVLSELLKLQEGTTIENLILSITTLLLVYWLWSKSSDE